MSIIEQWVIERPSTPEHLVRSWAIGIVPKPLARFEKRKVQLNQNTFDPRGCTYASNMTQRANNRGRDRTQADIDWFLKHKIDYWRTGAGMYMDRAVDMFCDRMNMNYPWERWTGRLIDFYSERKKYLDMGYMIMMGSMINDQYIEDTKDWKIDNPRWKTGIWHVRSIFLHTAYPCEALVENYLGVMPNNVIDLVGLDKLIEAKQFYHTAFIIYPTWKMPEPIKYPYMTVDQAEQLEKTAEAVIPWLLTPNFSESVRAWVELAEQGEDVYYEFKDFRGLDGVTKMMINLDKYRTWNK